VLKSSFSAGKMLFNVQQERILDVMYFLNAWKKRHYVDWAVGSNYNRKMASVYMKQRQSFKMAHTLEIVH
jgi:hypothetical protein